MIFDIKKWLSKYNFATFWWTVIHWQNFYFFSFDHVDSWAKIWLFRNHKKRKNAILKIIHFVETWPLDVKKLKTDCQTRFWNYKLTNLVSWKFAHLISQPRTGIRQNVVWLKTCPHGLFQAQKENPDFLFYHFPLRDLLNLSYFFNGEC